MILAAQLAAVLAAVVLAGWGVTRWMRASLIAGRTIRKIGQVHGGFVAVRGKVVPMALLQAPHAGKPCVFYRYAVEEMRVYTDYTSRRNFGSPRTHRRWVTVDKGSGGTDFLVEDGSGAALVRWQGADFALKVDASRQPEGPAATTFAGSVAGVFFGGSGDRRVTVTYLEPGDTVFVFGGTRPAHGHRAPPPLAPAPAVGSSTLRAQTSPLQPAPAGEPAVVFSQEAGAPIFLVSDQLPADLVRRHRTEAILSWIAGPVLVGLMLLLAHRSGAQW